MPEKLTLEEIEKKYDIEKKLVASTAHVTKTEMDFLRDLYKNRDNKYSVSVRDFGYGVDIHVDSVDIGFMSKNLLKLLELAKEIDCCWLTLDRDGTIYDHLPVFHW